MSVSMLCWMKVWTVRVDSTRPICEAELAGDLVDDVGGRHLLEDRGPAVALQAMGGVVGAEGDDRASRPLNSYSDATISPRNTGSGVIAVASPNLISILSPILNFGLPASTPSGSAIRIVAMSGRPVNVRTSTRSTS